MSRKVLFVGLAALLTGAAIFLFSSPRADAILLHGTFVDDNNSVHQNGIEAVAAAGITVGCTPPDNHR